VLGFGAGTFGGKGPLFSASVPPNPLSVLRSRGAGTRRSSRPRPACEAGQGPTRSPLRAATSFADVEAALRRLRTDYIDLLQLHAFDARTAVEDASVCWPTWSEQESPHHRRIQFLRLATDDVAGRIRSTGIASLCSEPGLLLADGPRLWMGA